MTLPKEDKIVSHDVTFLLSQPTTKLAIQEHPKIPSQYGEISQIGEGRGEQIVECISLAGDYI